ncbi:MAG: extracellular solute-binding protein [Candidatus Riflebacteria bacterium]|nr:extracellular solute-binding protein [Candidatus Riflebacteria bacterium]
MLIFFLFLGPVQSEAQITGTLATQPLEIFVSTELPLTSWSLDMIRTTFEKTLQRKVSILLKDSLRNILSYDFATETLILADDVNVSNISSRQKISPAIEFPIIWVLVYRKETFSKLATSTPQNLEGFINILRILRAKNSDFFPWFEGLFNKVSLYCIQTELSFPNSGKNSKVVDNNLSANKNEVDSFFHQILGENLLNPLSIEADENLAFEVFEAGDTAFTSMWIPEYAIDHPELLYLDCQTDWMGFPGATNFLPIPQLKLKLFSIDSTTHLPSKLGLTINRPFQSSLASERFCPYSATNAQEWVRSEFSSLYKKIVMGEP